MAETRVRTMQARGAARLEALIQASAELCLEGGYEALSIEALIERVGGSRRNVYAHFNGKEDLFVEAVTRRCQELGAPLRALKIDESCATMEEALQKFGHTVLSITLSPEVLALHRLMIAEGKRFPGLASKIFQMGHDTSWRALDGWLRHQQESGRLSSTIASDHLAKQFVSLVAADAQLRALVGTVFSDEELNATVEEAIATFLRGRVMPKK